MCLIKNGNNEENIQYLNANGVIDGLSHQYRTGFLNVDRNVPIYPSLHLIVNTVVDGNTIFTDQLKRQLVDMEESVLNYSVKDMDIDSIIFEIESYIRNAEKKPIIIIDGIEEMEPFVVNGRKLDVKESIEYVFLRLREIQRKTNAWIIIVCNLIWEDFSYFIKFSNIDLTDICSLIPDVAWELSINEGKIGNLYGQRKKSLLQDESGSSRTYLRLSFAENKLNRFFIWLLFEYNRSDNILIPTDFMGNHISMFDKNDSTRPRSSLHMIKHSYTTNSHWINTFTNQLGNQLEDRGKAVLHIPAKNKSVKDICSEIDSFIMREGTRPVVIIHGFEDIALPVVDGRVMDAEEGILDSVDLLDDYQRETKLWIIFTYSSKRENISEFEEIFGSKTYNAIASISGTVWKMSEISEECESFNELKERLLMKRGKDTPCIYLDLTCVKNKIGMDGGYLIFEYDLADDVILSVDYMEEFMEMQQYI